MMVLRLPLQRVGVCRHLQQKAHLWCRNFVILYTKCSWSCFYSGALCIVISHFYPLRRDLDHHHPLPSTPRPYFIVQVFCTIVVLYNGMDIPVNNAYSIWYQTTKAEEQAWDFMLLVHVASVYPTVAAACGVLCAAHCCKLFSLILQEPSTKTMDLY